MRDLYLIRCLCVFSVWLFSLGVAFGQQIDTTAYHELSGVEVVEKVRPSVTREGTPLQIMDRAGIDRLGVQDLSEAVKRFSGVTVQDYGGIGGLKTVSVRSLGAKHTAVSYDGVTITDAQSGQVDISRFSLDNVEMVSLSIGQSDDIFQTARVYASAGALNIQTGKPTFKDKSFHTYLKVKGGSFGLFNPVLHYDQKLGKRWSASLHGDFVRADGQYPYTLINGELETKEKRRNSDIHAYHLEGNYSAILEGEANFPLRRTILIRSGDFPVLLIYITRTLLNDYGIITFSCNRGIRMFLMRNLRYGPWLSIIMLLLVI